MMTNVFNHITIFHKLQSPFPTLNATFKMSNTFFQILQCVAQFE
jgi:hypothetical protein